MVGRRSVGTRLGFVRGGLKGPWLLRAVFSALERRAAYVDWDDVESWDGNTVHVGRRRDELDRLNDGSDGQSRTKLG
jgi:hypothetical protein